MSNPKDTKDSLPKVPPFYEKKTTPQRKTVDVRGLLSTSLMLVSWAALSLALAGGAVIVFDILTNGLSESIEGLGAKVIILGLTYAFGWVVALVSIRGFGNLVYPIIIRIYAWFVLAGIGVLYLRAIYKLYLQFDDLG
ncbi:MAG: hypothetical protein AB1649_23085, partial [Chloroflexota bacterium]